MPSFEDYVFHPAILDAAIHVVVNPRLSGNYDRDLYFFSSRLAALRLLPAFREKPFPNTLFTHATFVNWAPGKTAMHSQYMGALMTRVYSR